MSLLTWWRTDTLPQLSLTTKLSVQPSENVELLATVARLHTEVVHARMAAQHIPYVAFFETLPVAYGWVAYRQASIGELRHAFRIPSGERYLWDFATLPPWRGRGIYPRLLQAIVTQEYAERFWIIHVPENEASARGIRKAGFQPVGLLSFRADGRPGLAKSPMSIRAQTGAELLGVSSIDLTHGETLTPCWHCTLAARQSAVGAPYTVANCAESCQCIAFHTSTSCYY